MGNKKMSRLINFNRIQALCSGEEFIYKLNIDPTIIAQKVCSKIYDNVKTSQLDELSSQIAISMYSKNPDYGKLASRIVVSNHHKRNYIHIFRCYRRFYTIKILFKVHLYNLVLENKDIINDKINHIKDYELDFFGFKTLEKSYLLKIDEEIVERPQYLFLRVALCIHRHNLEKAFETYDHISNKDLFTQHQLFLSGPKENN